MEFHSSSDAETIEIGRQIAKKLHGGDIVLLSGDLGAGKTTLTKGIAEGLSFIDEITSPTFTIMNVYNARSQKSEVGSLIHIDTYRLKNEQELLAIGARDYLGDTDTVCVVEWPEKIDSLLENKKTVRVELRGLSNTERLVRIS